MATLKKKINELTQKENPVLGDSIVISDSENSGRGALVEITDIQTLIGGGGGAVDSVAGKTGVVTLDAADISETATRKFFTSDERTKLTGIAENANNYTHPATHPQSMIEGLATDLAGKATKWAYQEHSGGTITGEPWNIHSFSSSGTLNLPKASTVPDGTQIAAMLVPAGDTSVQVMVDAGDQFITPVGMRQSYTFRATVTSFVFVKVTSNTWAALGGQELLKEGTPASSSANGTKGATRFDANYFYVCTATNTWVRFAKDGSWT